MDWFENLLQMREPWDMDEKEFLAMADSAFIQQEVDNKYGEGFLKNYMSSLILDAKYKKTPIKGIVEKQTHLNQRQRDDLYIILSKHAKLFDGTLGVYPHK